MCVQFEYVCVFVFLFFVCGVVFLSVCVLYECGCNYECACVNCSESVSV